MLGFAMSKYRLVTEYGLADYPCGLSAGDRLRLKVEIVVCQEGTPTGEVHSVGGVWTVLRGVVDEPDIVWLRQPDGKSHTWTGCDIFETFERVTDALEEAAGHPRRP